MYELAKIVNILKEKKVIFYICFNSSFEYLHIDLDKIYYEGISLITFKIINYNDEKFLNEYKEIISLIKDYPTKNAESNVLKYKDVLKQMRDYKINKDIKKDVIKCLEMLKSLWLCK